MEEYSFRQYENILSTVKGSFDPEQFSIFLNMYSWEVNDNYLVLFHEIFHHWQSVFTPYGHLKWGVQRTVSAEVIDLWLNATKDCPSSRILPAASILPCTNINQIKCISNIYQQDIALKLFFLKEKNNDSFLQNLLPLSIDEICPTVCLQGNPYKLNGIDILEGWAKFQEASLAYITEEKQLSETIDPNYLQPEYYSALYYYIEKVGIHRLFEFPIACELSLLFGKTGFFDKEGKWKKYHPAWRFIRIVDIISNLTAEEILSNNNVKEFFVVYTKNILKKCGFENWEDVWTSAKEYAEQTDLQIPKEMQRAIDLKQKFPWMLSFPFLDINIFQRVKDFHPYYFITSDDSSLAVNSNSIANEVIIENHFQAFAHQICGQMSKRCLDRGKLQCGYSYYGLHICKYMLNGTCDGHVDCNTSLPDIKLDCNSNIIEGCDFQLFLSLMMKISLKDIVVTDISKKIDPDLLKADIQRLKEDR